MFYWKMNISTKGGADVADSKRRCFVFERST